jgi:hypothetical protein
MKGAIMLFDQLELQLSGISKGAIEKTVDD